MDPKAQCLKVSCGVENCVYNEERLCHADALEVNSMDNKRADMSEETCCTTFKDGK